MELQLIQSLMCQTPAFLMETGVNGVHGLTVMERKWSGNVCVITQPHRMVAKNALDHLLNVLARIVVVILKNMIVVNHQKVYII